MERKERMIKLLKQYLLLCAGLAVMAFGVAFSVKAVLGTSPISSVPCVVSMFTPFTVGTATIVMHCVFIALQILILRILLLSCHFFHSFFLSDRYVLPYRTVR